MTQSESIELDVATEEAGERLDRFLAARLPQLSRTRLKALILAGFVADGDGPIDKANAKVAAGDLITVALPPPEVDEPTPENIALDIVYEDADLVVIDKPAGLVVHPAPGHWTGTLVNALLHHCGSELSGIGGVRRPGIVHRLDKDTSGLLVVAKSDVAHRGLAEQFADHGRTGPLEREYRAFAWGVPERARLTIDAPLARDPRNRERMAVVSAAAGRFAITHVERLASFGSPPLASSLACRLETGRTHQIRVHLAHIGHPLLGDDVYGSRFKSKAARLPEAAREALGGLGRQALHAYLLAFRHPVTGRSMRFSSELPRELARLHSTLAAM
jgi:23S rRNA pseudouridine1911/1915/1917 synthase